MVEAGDVDGVRMFTTGVYDGDVSPHYTREYTTRGTWCPAPC